MESGGCYYASAVADILKKKLVLFRKAIKNYNIINRFVGNIPTRNDSIVIIDDVISSGNTIAEAVTEFKKIGCKIEVVTIFSYCWEHVVSDNLGVKILTLVNADELIEYGLSNKLLTEGIAKTIKDYIKREEFRVYKSPN